MATAITEFSKEVQPDVIGCPKVLVDKAVVDTIIKFCTDTHLLEKTIEQDVVTADVDTTDNYSVDITVSDYIANVKPLTIIEFKIDGSRFETSYIELLSVLGDIDDYPIVGTKYYTIVDDADFRFYGIEAKDQTFFLKAAFAPVDTITTIDDTIYRRWHDAIESGAKSKLQAMPKKDWTDYQAAAYNLNVFNDGIASAKISHGQGYTKGNTRPKSMRFF